MPYSTLMLPLRLDEVARVEIEKRFEAGFQMYRALLREGLRRLDLCRESRAWQAACTTEDKRERDRLYQEATKRYGLDEYALVKHATVVRHGAPQFQQHLGNAECQALAKRAWEAIRRHTTGDSSGRRSGRPRTPRLEEFTCLSSRSGNTQGITIRGSYQAGRSPKGTALYEGTRGMGRVPLQVRWGVTPKAVDRLVLPLECAHSGARAARHGHYLEDPERIVDVEIVRTRIRGRWRYSVHIKVDKPPYRDPARYAHAPDNKVGIDLGPQRLAVVPEDLQGALLYTPTPEERDREKRIRQQQRRLQRAQERSRRANGTSRRTKSKTYLRRQGTLRELQRRRTAEAVRRENEIAKEVVTHGGRHVVTEDLAVKPWARLWGASIQRFTPARFLEAIEREAVLAGGTIRKVSPWTSALSSTCVCGKREKKPLSQRRHVCTDCGAGTSTVLDRDLFSAFLCLHLSETEDRVDASRARAAWAGAEELLAVAASTPTSKLVGPTRNDPAHRVGVSPPKLEPDSYPEDVVAARRGPTDGIREATAEAVSGHESPG